jgi:Flp pilus assembly protein TadG
MRRWWTRSERGQSLVEFALVLPLLLMVLFAIMDFGRIFQGYVTLANASREGARLAATGCGNSVTYCSDGTIQARVTARDGNLTTTTTVSYPDTGGKKQGNSVRVRVNTTITLVTPLAPIIALAGGGSFNSSFALASTADMRLE